MCLWNNFCFLFFFLFFSLPIHPCSNLQCILPWLLLKRSSSAICFLVLILLCALFTAVLFQLTVAHADLHHFEMVQPFSFQFKAGLGGNGYRNILLDTVDSGTIGWLHLLWAEYTVNFTEKSVNSFADDYIPAASSLALAFLNFLASVCVAVLLSKSSPLLLTEFTLLSLHSLPQNSALVHFIFLQYNSPQPPC